MRFGRKRSAVLASTTEPINTGTRAATMWLAERGITPPSIKRWHCEVSLATVVGVAPATFDDRTDTRFHIDVYAEEWGFFFCHQGRASWIRVTDIPFVHGRDDFALLAHTPSLADIGRLLKSVEADHQLEFKRKFALVRTNVAGAEATVRKWVESL